LAGFCLTRWAGWFSDRRGERLTILGGLVLEAAGLLILVQAQNLWGFAAALAAIAAGGGILLTTYSSLLSKMVPEKIRGLASATLQTVFGLVHLPAPWVGAQLWERWTPRAPFAVSAVAILVSALPARFKLRSVGGKGT
jgi:MFS family permease